MNVIGLNPLGETYFSSCTSGVSNITNIELSNAVYDELHVRQSTGTMTTSSEKDNWQIDTVMLARFENDLEAGNFQNDGVKISKFAVRRRKFGETQDLVIGYKDLTNDVVFTYQDYTQPRGKLIYTVVPIGDNTLEAKGSSVIVESDFSGFHIVDKDKNHVLSFDKFIGSEPNVSMTLNKGRVQIDTFSKYPSFFYNEQQYHTFSLQAAFLKDEWESLNAMYEFVLNEFVTSYKPFIVKGGDGSVYVVNVDQASRDVPLGIYSQREHMTLNVECTEVMDYKDYIEEV